MDKFIANVFNGTLEVKGTLHASDLPSIGVSFALSNAKLKDMLSFLFGWNNLDGYVSVAGSVGTTGVTPVTLINKLTGVFTIAARAVKLDGIDLHRLIDILPTSSSESIDRMVQDALSQGTTEFYTADGNFTIKEGLLAIKKLDMATTRTTGALAGNLDLNNWAMSLLSQFSFYITNSTDGRQANDKLSLGINLQGDITQPVKKLDTKIVQNYIKGRR